jgi:hypothetical protein
VGNWLDDHFAEGDSNIQTQRLVTSLRSYLKHCRRRVQAGDCRADELCRRREKIADACFKLWELARRDA